MLTANIDGNRSRPIPSAVGVCPFCRSEMVPRCGEVRIHHWAHKSKANCDPWREPETDWHRNWKNEFPLSWQEKIFQDEATGERHIADVHTLSGLTVEVQHSHLDPTERRAREEFYRNMIWVVDGSRLKGNREKISEWRNTLVEISQGQSRTNLFLTDKAEELFPNDWLECPVPVCFDYMGPKGDVSSAPQVLFLLYPGTVHGGRLVEPLPRGSLLRAIFAERVDTSSVRSVTQRVARLRLSNRRR
ncbi:competence protein CoiA family protein [uncultured Pseudophaeobacter sp.]|uniref:competence protein CoiA n=1 Tax=uncultured Pseudophaeobacter sp. TaxID=1759421 RepID=UPI00343AF243